MLACAARPVDVKGIPCDVRAPGKKILHLCNPVPVECMCSQEIFEEVFITPSKTYCSLMAGKSLFAKLTLLSILLDVSWRTQIQKVYVMGILKLPPLKGSQPSAAPLMPLSIACTGCLLLLLLHF